MDSEISITINRASIHTFIKHKGDAIDNICHLCRLPILFPTFEETEKLKTNIIIAKGICGHIFHRTCIAKYLESGKVSCPIDYTAWKLQTTYINGISSSGEKEVKVETKVNPNNIVKIDIHPLGNLDPKYFPKSAFKPIIYKTSSKPPQHQYMLD
jgi:hypothetical protein